MSSPPTPLSTSNLESWEPNDIQKLLHTLIHRHCVFSGMHTCAAEMERTMEMLTSEQLAELGIPEEPSGQFLIQWFTIYRELFRLKGTDTTLQEKLVTTADRIRLQGEGMPAPPPPSAMMPPRPPQGQKRKASVAEEQPSYAQQQRQQQPRRVHPLRQQPSPQMLAQTQAQAQVQMHMQAQMPSQSQTQTHGQSDVIFVQQKKAQPEVIFVEQKKAEPEVVFVQQKKAEPEVVFVQQKKASLPEKPMAPDHIFTRPPPSALRPQPASLNPNPHGEKSWEEILPKTKDGNWDTRKIDNDVIRTIDDYQLRLMILSQRNRQLLQDAREKDRKDPSNVRYL